jgi:hypothetical protein
MRPAPRAPPTVPWHHWRGLPAHQVLEVLPLTRGTAGLDAYLMQKDSVAARRLCHAAWILKAPHPLPLPLPLPLPPPPPGSPVGRGG